MQQVPVRRVDLDDASACRQHAPGGTGKRVDDLAEAAGIERLGRLVPAVEGRRAGARDWRPATAFDGERPAALEGGRRARLASRVRELHAWNGALRRDEAEDAREHLDVRVLPDSEVVRTDPAVGEYGSRLGQHGPCAANRPAAEVDEMPVAREPVDARVLAHRRDDNAVAERDAAQREAA